MVHLVHSLRVLFRLRKSMDITRKKGIEERRKRRRYGKR